MSSEVANIRGSNRSQTGGSDIRLLGYDMTSCRALFDLVSSCLPLIHKAWSLVRDDGVRTRVSYELMTGAHFIQYEPMITSIDQEILRYVNPRRPCASSLMQQTLLRKSRNRRPHSANTSQMMYVPQLL